MTHLAAPCFTCELFVRVVKILEKTSSKGLRATVRLSVAEVFFEFALVPRSHSAIKAVPLLCFCLTSSRLTSCAARSGKSANLRITKARPGDALPHRNCLTCSPAEALKPHPTETHTSSNGYNCASGPCQSKRLWIAFKNPFQSGTNTSTRAGRPAAAKPSRTLCQRLVIKPQLHSENWSPSLL